MTNLDKWFAYTDGLPAPNNYRLWGWLSCIASALQRRVWCPPNHDRLYPNMYITLVGKPGIGKDGIIRAVNDILSHHKLEDIKPGDGLSDDEKLVAAAIHAKDVKAANEEMSNISNKEASVDKAPLFCSAPNATTFQALVLAMSKAVRRQNYFDEKDGKKTMGIYTHSSIHFTIGEMSSLFRKHTEDLVNFMIEAYDCNESYEYQTIGRGKDRIRRLCLNFFAATNPDFMASTFDEKLLNQGFSSRCIYVYAHKNRKVVTFRPELTESAAAYRREILEHVRKLSTLYGQVQISQETRDWFQAWAEKDAAAPHLRSSQSAKLESYYARKGIHMMKVAVAHHFGESTDMEVTLDDFKWAAGILAEEEKTMGMALTMNGNNPLYNSSIRITEYLRATGKHTFTELLVEFWGKVRQPELEEILDFLGKTDQVIMVKEVDPLTQEIQIYYKTKE